MDKLELLAEQYKNCCAENDALKAKLDSSESLLDRMDGYRYLKMEEENSRYRDALEFIANGGVASSSIKHRYINEAYQEIAKEALKGKE